MSVLDDLREAREAYERREWVAAYDALSGLEAVDLTPDDFVALANAAYLLGRRNDVIQSLQRAYQEYLDRDDVPGAARAAYWLVATLWGGGEVAVGNGWLARAQRLLDEYDGDIVERGYLQERVTFGHVMKGEFGDAVAAAPLVTEYGRRFGDPDLLAMGLHVEGRMTIFSGRVSEGLRLLDEAMISVIAGEVSPIYSGVIYCSAIEAVQQISDLDRAGQWTHALTAWCDGQPGLVAYTGQCAVHRGQLMRLHGAFDDALQELQRAIRRYADAGGSAAVGEAYYEQGEVLRLRGSHDDAEAAYDRAAEHGHATQPGRALLWLARGRRDAALSAVERLLAERQDPVHRSQVLAAAVEVMVDAGRAEDAAPLAAQLSELGTEFDCTALQAAGAHAMALVALARAEPEAALLAGRRCTDAWSSLDAPYEVARGRVLIGRALRLLGDERSAVAELCAARDGFAALGASPAARAADDLVGDTAVPAGLSPREVEVLRLVAAGRSNPQIAVELVLSEKTVARHLSNIFAKLDVGSRTAAAAFAYEHDLA
ncbi:helix-turn-helix transcriptional regulator [Nocardioides limicola]|uniref:helix-turn-helix transcriptional regulator n=1 Tax=Nocardioides limicola TaxID=2803368 RepID=UPI00193C4807|nr:LuxR family transcriptional regulator [Nocardioides sp. DJM-14]